MIQIARSYLHMVQLNGFETHDIQEAIIPSSCFIVMDKNSGSIKEIMDNTISRPRTPLSTGFADIWRYIHDLL